VNAETRALVLRRVSDARRQLVGAELDANEDTDMQAAGMKRRALPLVAWEVAERDPLLALAYALDFLELKRESAEAA
jgi:hypothetical protein